MSFMLGNHLIFLDSFQYMAISLERLAGNLPEDAFRYTKMEYKESEKLELMKHKGVYPYDYMDSSRRFEERKLPAKEQFYSVLNDKHINDEEYKHKENVWNKFNIQNMGEYHDLYLKTDVLLLADVFENFRKTCIQYYKLDPCHYFTILDLLRMLC